MKVHKDGRTRREPEVEEATRTHSRTHPNSATILHFGKTEFTGKPNATSLRAAAWETFRRTQEGYLW